MRRLSIKAQVTLWYTGLLLALLAAGLIFLFSSSSSILSRQLRDVLLDVVSDAVSSTHFERDELDADDIDFYRDGVSIFIFDTTGHLLAPKTNRGIQVDSVLQDQSVRIVDSGREEWMVHDVYAEADSTGFWVRGVVSTSGTQGTLGSMLRLSLIGGPAFLIIAALGGYLITRRAFAKVGEMARIADAITTGDDLSLRVPDSGDGDEFSRLAGTLNVMLERLRLSFERERQFTSDASHELRTPTAILLSQCEYGLSPQASCEERIDCLRVIQRQAKRMNTLLSQLLLLARADSGRLQLSLEPVDLSELCEMTALELQDTAQEKEIQLSYEVTPHVTIQGDETLLIRLITNLLQNAIRYNRPGGTVFLRVSQEGADGILTVSDTGIGIREEDLDKIFDRFYRADTSRSSEGTGLGLSMVRWIARAHGGDVSVRSIYGSGSTFIVTLPTAGPDAPGEKLPGEKQPPRIPDHPSRKHPSSHP